MKITVKLFASLGSYLPSNREGNQAAIEIEDSCGVAGVINGLSLPPKMTHLVLLNGVYLAPSERAEARLKEGDVLAIWPPVAGG